MTGRGGQSFAVLAVRAIHTAVFLVELASIAWLLISGMLSRRDRSVGFAAAAVAAESIVFCANDGVCPLTPLAERLGSAHGQVSDLFLPDRVARTIPIWSSALIVLAILLHARVPISRCVTPDRSATTRRHLGRQCGAGRDSVFRH